MRLVLMSLLLMASAAEAAVYKCLQGGATRYSDQPCAPGDAPAELPPVTAVPARKGDDLDQQYRERLSREKKSRDKADAATVKSNQQRIAREQAVRAAIINHQVIKGMSHSEVESALGRADERPTESSWRYRRDGQRITIQFNNAVVSSVTTTTEKKRK